ncbi:MAG TPA: hypothetical protein V6D11_09695 [Waterburya sp.]
MNDTSAQYGNLVCGVNPDCVDNAEKCRHYESINLPVVEPMSFSKLLLCDGKLGYGDVF